MKKCGAGFQPASHACCGQVGNLPHTFSEENDNETTIGSATYALSDRAAMRADSTASAGKFRARQFQWFRRLCRAGDEGLESARPGRGPGQRRQSDLRERIRLPRCPKGVESHA